MTVEENRKWWGKYDWPQDGEEWSDTWGGAWAQWNFCIRPRIAGWLPIAAQGRTLEIAFGRGRWTEFLLRECGLYVGFDIVQAVVDYAQNRFRSEHHRAEFRLCDGKTLPGISNNQIDFAFSFDSLVHAEADVIEAYLKELARVLVVGGTAFIHHSNMAACPGATNPGARSLDMSAELFARSAGEAGVPCLLQERIAWGPAPDTLRDCLSTIHKGGCIGGGHPVLSNLGFIRDAARIKEFGARYAP